MIFTKHSNVKGEPAKEIPCITGSGAPTASTEGAIGVLYMDFDTGEVYKCTEVADGVYTWKALVESGGGTSMVGIIIPEFINNTSGSHGTSVDNGASYFPKNAITEFSIPDILGTSDWRIIIGYGDGFSFEYTVGTTIVDRKTDPDYLYITNTESNMCYKVPASDIWGISIWYDISPNTTFAGSIVYIKNYS